ncbi:repetitive organellar protein-like [Diorhabda sublineata]|uniref:repetitive organellar protein-like n=1 Tax=Diorhabda sublineata TaxID=1163346 RepID=UPI0024E0EC8B|nr:repetitive organellar protein-like [Diorhabda sublineata]
MTESTSALDILNTIKFCNNIKDHQKWATEASSQFFKIEIEKLKITMEYFEKEKARVEEDIKNITPKIEILEKYYKTLIDDFRVNEDSLFYQSLHLKCVVKSVIKHKEKGENLLREYRDEADKYREKLEANSPNYQILKEKTSILLKIKFNIQMLRHNVKELRMKNRMKSIYSTKLFHKDFIDFAAAWLEKKRYVEAVNKLDSLKKLQAELIVEMIGNKSSTNKKYFKPNIKEKQKFVRMDISELPVLPTTEHLSKEESVMSTFGGRAALNSWHNSNYLADNQFTTVSPKVKIIENKVLNNAPEKSFVNTIMEQKTNAIDMKFQQLMKSFERFSSEIEKTSPKRSESKEKSDKSLMENTIENMSQKERDRALEIKLKNIVKNFKRPPLQKNKIRSQNSVSEKVTKIVGVKEDAASPMGKPSAKVNDDISTEQDTQNHLTQEKGDGGKLLSQQSNSGIQVKPAEVQHDLKEVHIDYENFPIQMNSMPTPKNMQQFTINNNYRLEESNKDNKEDKHVDIKRKIPEQKKFEKKIDKPLTKLPQYLGKNETYAINETKSFGIFGKSTNISEQSIMKRGSDYHNNNNHAALSQTEKHFINTGFTTDENYVHGSPDDFNSEFLMSPIYDPPKQNETEEPAMIFPNSSFAFQGMNFGFNF